VNVLCQEYEADRERATLKAFALYPVWVVLCSCRTIVCRMVLLCCSLKTSIAYYDVFHQVTTLIPGDSQNLLKPTQWYLPHNLLLF
jgi:hypothetical protein